MDVQVSGVIDNYVEAYYTDSQTTARLSSGGASGSRLRFSGTEDISEGLKAFFVLESGILTDQGTSTPDNASQSKYLFQREVSVGLKGDFGSLSFGRQYTPNFLSFVTCDPIGMSLGSGISAFAEPSWGGTFNGNAKNDTMTRRDNSISYVSPTFAGWRGEFFVSLGENTDSTTNVMSSTDGNVYSGAVRYWTKTTRINLALSAMNEESDMYRTNAYMATFSAVHDFGFVKPSVILTYKKAGDIDVNSPDILVGQLAAQTPLCGGRLYGSVAYAKNYTVDEANAVSYGVRYDYDLSKRTMVYAGFAAVDNGENAQYRLGGGGGSTAGISSPAGENHRTIFAGMTHRF